MEHRGAGSKENCGRLCDARKVIAGMQSSVQVLSMRNRRIGKASGVVLFSLIASTFSAHAGMTVYGLSDVYKLRLQEVSFFLLLLFVCSFAFKLLWNHAVRGFNSLPRLRFGRTVHR